MRDLFSRYVLRGALANQSDTACAELGQFFVVTGCPSDPVDNGAPFGGGRSGALAPERVVVALGHRVEFSGQLTRGQRCARTDASGLQSRCSRPPAPSVRHEKTHSSLDQLLQSRASSRSLGPARARADVLAEQSAHAGAVAKIEISVRVGDKESAQPGHIKWQGRERFVGRPLLGNW